MRAGLRIVADHAVRLIVENRSGKPKNTLVVISIEDYR
jgi:hypothetical protein